MDVEGGSLASVVRDLLGCDWGRKVLTGTLGVDLSACTARATRRVAFHDPASGLVATLQFCPTHIELVRSETNPHAEEN